MKFQKDKAALCKAANECRDRGALGMTLYVGDQIEFSNGITFRLKKIDSKTQVRISVAAPRDVEIWRLKHELP